MDTNNSKKYFLLNAECYFVKGAVRGAIYDLELDRVISIGPELKEILESTEKMYPLEDALKNCSEKKKAMDILGEFEACGLGKFYEKPTVIEKIKPKYSKLWIKKMNVIPPLRVLYIEINNNCSLNCSFCNQYPDRVVKRKGCSTWSRNQVERPLFGLDEQLQILVECKKLGCNNVVFIGGDPILDWVNLRILIDKAKLLKYNISILTNGINLDESKVQYLKMNSVNIFLQFFSSDEEKYNQTVKVNGAFSKVFKSLKLLNRYLVDFSFIVTLMDGDDESEIKSWLTQFSPKQIIVDSLFLEDSIMLPSFRDRNVKESLNDVKPKSYTREKFFQNCQGHTCWEGQLTVNANGELLPCPFARTEIIANLLDKKLSEVIRDRDYEKYWDLTKDDIEGCNECEYRFLCFDCRVIEKSLSKTFNSKSNLCTYDPMKGVWEKNIC